MDVSIFSSSLKTESSAIPLWEYFLLVFVLLVFILMIFKISRGKKEIKSSKSEPVTLCPPSTNIIPGNAQHIGGRLEQQDSFGFSDIDDKEFINQFGVLAVLADGMGGLSGGKQASHLAVTTFLDYYLTTPYISSISEKLISALEVANDAVLQFGRENGIEGGVGTTLIAAVVFQNKLYWLSIGDSRIYLKHGETLTKLTTDHIYARELDEKVALGEITKEEAEADPQRASLISFLGLGGLEILDVSNEPIFLEKGDSVILCSDGLYGSVSNSEMVETCQCLPSQEAAEELIALAIGKQQLNQDNATVAIMTIKDERGD